MYKHYEDLKKNKGNYVFIAMDFSQKSQPVYEDIIYPTVLDSGLLPVRCDEVTSASESLYSQMQELIRNAKFVIADITYARQKSYANVFLEVGYAIALSKPIIIISQDDGEDYPFDIDNLRITKYDLSESGKAKARKSIRDTLRKESSSPSLILQKVISLNGKKNIAIFGYAKKEHIDSVYPKISETYQQRLNASSSSILGVSRLATAIHQISWSKGLDDIEIEPLNGYGIGEDVFQSGNIFIFGGPGSNPLFKSAERLAKDDYLNVLDIIEKKIEPDKKQFFIAQGDRLFPDPLYGLDDNKKDFGFIMRFSNPSCEGATITIACGLRSFATEGAIRLLTTPSLIAKMEIFRELVPDTAFWALIEVTHNDCCIQEINVFESQFLLKR